MPGYASGGVKVGGGLSGTGVVGGRQAKPKAQAQAIPMPAPAAAPRPMSPSPPAPYTPPPAPETLGGLQAAPAPREMDALNGGVGGPLRGDLGMRTHPSLQALLRGLRY